MTHLESPFLRSFRIDRLTTQRLWGFWSQCAGATLELLGEFIRVRVKDARYFIAAELHIVIKKVFPLLKGGFLRNLSLFVRLF